MTNSNAAQILKQGDETIAYHKTEGQGPTLIWCGGLKSDMNGSKALFLEGFAKRLGLAFIRFDYFGHGQSSGNFRDGTISRWAADISYVMDNLSDGDVILIGSSMGGWASLLAMRAKPERVKAMVLIAPAPDFTQKLIWESWPQAKREQLVRDGIIYEPSGYEEPYAYTLSLFEDGRKNLLLDAPIAYDGPVRILQGVEDSVVPWTYPGQIAKCLTSEDVTVTLVKSGDHSLSRPQDLNLLARTIETVLPGHDA